jgi:signal recognition particle subunit SRP54
MFDLLTDKLGDVFRSIRGRGRITEDNVREAMRGVRTALLEADVHMQVVRDFADRCVEKAIGAEVIKTLHPEQVIVKIVYDDLVGLMGPVDSRIPYVSPGPTIILMAGLQGSGKTTTCGKLARKIMGEGKKPMLVAADLQRPAAIDQLEILGQQLNVPVYAERGQDNPVRVCRNAVEQARKQGLDVVILDTAGRLAIDEALMEEIGKVAHTVNPHQVYLVTDAMTGQDAVTSAKAFNERLELDGVILTKFDSDTRGGAALSIKTVTGKPIKFIGVGEKLDAIEPFHPERIASRILGMGDIVTLVEKAQEQFDADAAMKAQEKMAKGKFDFDDFLGQLQSMRKMGPMKEILKLIPGVGSALKDLQIDEGELDRVRGIIHSMSKRERQDPDLIDASRRRRIARGAGVEPQEVSGLVKQFGQMRDMMKEMSKMGLRQRVGLASQLGKLGMMGGKMPQIKASTGTNPALERRRKEQRRKDRKKHRR